MENDAGNNWKIVLAFIRNYSPSSGENWVPTITLSNENDNTQLNMPIKNGLRPVFKLKNNLKVTGGDGSEGDPYTLGV